MGWALGAVVVAYLVGARPHPDDPHGRRPQAAYLLSATFAGALVGLVAIHRLGVAVSEAVTDVPGTVRCAAQTPSPPPPFGGIRLPTFPPFPSLPPLPPLRPAPPPLPTPRPAPFDCGASGGRSAAAADAVRDGITALVAGAAAALHAQRATRLPGEEDRS